MAAKIFRLSKSQFCKARKCMKSLWLYRHNKAVADSPSEFQQNIFNQGKEVGALATRLFPKGIMIAAEYNEADLAIEQTKKAISENAEAIFEAGFQYGNLLVRVDILKNNNDGTWDILEVKSTNSVEPKAHYDDVAVQKWVVTNSGIKVNRSCLVHLNRDYCFDKKLELEKLFVLESLDDLVSGNLQEIPNMLESIQVHLNLPNEPTEDIGSRCNNPYQCEFTGYCWSHVKVGSIHSLSRISDTKKADLLDKGIDQIVDIPEAFKLSENQLVEVKGFKEGEVQIDLESIKDHLKELKYPLYYLDYESVAYAVPRYQGTWPHKQLTTQYSLHVQEKPNSDLKHFAFVHDDESDPSKAIANQLLTDIKDDGGSIVVYHKTFERDRTKELAEQFPERSHQLTVLIDRMWDLEIPFAKRWYWDHKFDGSSSIKNVLPIFKPDFSYDDLEIRKGDQAQLEYSRMITMPKNDAHREKIRQALLKYCERDSIAMYLILKELFEVVTPRKRSKTV